MKILIQNASKTLRPGILDVLGEILRDLHKSTDFQKRGPAAQEIVAKPDKWEYTKLTSLRAVKETKSEESP